MTRACSFAQLPLAWEPRPRPLLLSPTHAQRKVHSAGVPGLGGTVRSVLGSPRVSCLVAHPGVYLLTFPVWQREAFVRCPSPELGLGFGEKPSMGKTDCLVWLAPWPTGTFPLLECVCPATWQSPMKVSFPHNTCVPSWPSAQSVLLLLTGKVLP